MASLTIKDIPNDLLARLRRLAAEEHRSLNKEVIHLLAIATCQAPPHAPDIEKEIETQVAAWRDIQKRFDVDLPDDIMDRRTPGRPVDL